MESIAELWYGNFRDAYIGAEFYQYLMGGQDQEGYPFPMRFAWMMGIALVAALLATFVFYIIIPSPKHTRVGGWVVTLLVASGLTFIASWIIAQTSLTYCPEEYMYPGGIDTPMIGTSNCINVGWITGFLSLLLAIVLSFVVRIKSRHARNVPF